MNYSELDLLTRITTLNSYVDHWSDRALRAEKAANDLDWSKKVAEWNKTAGVTQEPTIEDLILAMKLILEEVNELDYSLIRPYSAILTADAIGDSIVTLLGLAFRLKIDMAPVMEEIFKSNDSKFIGGIKRRADGKILKGDHFVQPDIKGALKKGRVF